VLPPQSIRVVSMVPTDASDIRDTTTETFADVDQQSFRASVLIVTGGILFALAGLMALVGLVRLVGRFRKPSGTTDRLVTDAAILRAVGRELAAVQRARHDGGWTPELAGRALAPLRVAAAYAVGRKVGQAAADARPRGASDELRNIDRGLVFVQTGWPKTRRVAVSGSVTQQAVAREIARGDLSAGRTAMLESLEQALTRFTAAQYGRESSLDANALDQSLDAGVSAVRRLKIEQLPLVKRVARRRGPATEVESRVWSR
jgi:hypothetical protein